MHTRLEAPAVEPLSRQGQDIEVARAGRRYRGRRGEVAALAEVDLEIAPGQVVAVVGPSGCGKSTLLELVAGLQEPDEGRVAVAGTADAESRRAVASPIPVDAPVMTTAPLTTGSLQRPGCMLTGVNRGARGQAG